MRPLLPRRAFACTLPLALLRPTVPPAWAVRPYAEQRFRLDLPDGFAISKRSTSVGTLFVAGNFPRAAVVSVSAWPLQPLLAHECTHTWHDTKR